MTFPQIAAFARLANGSVAPTRTVGGQASLLSRAQHDMYYDEVHDEFTIANPLAQAILTYRGGANGKEAPIRVIQGPRTQIASPDFGVQVDPVNNEIYVVEHDYILVFPRTAIGDVAPIRVLRGPHTQLENSYGDLAARNVAVDPINDLLFVGGTYHNSGRILIFNRADAGNVKPRGMLMGPKTGLGETPRPEVYKALLLASVRGGIGVWSVHDEGDVPPRLILGATRDPGDTTWSGGIGSFALNPKAKEIIGYVGSSASEDRAAIRTFSFPEIF